MELTQEKVEKLMADESFTSGWAAATTKEQICQLLNNYGFDVSKEEVNSFLDTTSESSDNELTDESLENVSGGGWFSDGIFRYRKRGACGTRCFRCGRINGIFGHLCKSPF